MKRIVFILSLMFVIMSVMAIPAKKGIWRTLALENGTEARAMLCGDEHVHFWMTEDGQRFEEIANERFVPITITEINRRAAVRRAVCGLSMGGGHTFHVSLLYPTMFDYYGLFSAGLHLNNGQIMGGSFADQIKASPDFAQQSAKLFGSKPKIFK